MKSMTNAFLAVLLMAGSLFFQTPGAAAQPTIGYPFGFLHDASSFATNLVSGDLIEVGAWLEMLPGEPTGTVRYEGQLGSIAVASEATASGPSLSILADYVSADDLMSQCVEGVIQVKEVVLIRDQKGNFSIEYGLREFRAPCSWGSVALSLNMPHQVFVCGPNNDQLVMPEQPAHVYLYLDTGWIDHLRKLQFLTDEGYELSGPANLQFFDDPANGCAPEIPLASPSATVPPYLLPTPQPTPQLYPMPGLPTPGLLPGITPIPVLPPFVTPETLPEKEEAKDDKEDGSQKPSVPDGTKEVPTEKPNSEGDKN